MTLDRRPYIRPTALQRELLAALVDTGTVVEAAKRVGMTVTAAEWQMREARRYSGLTTAQLIAFGVRDGWLSVA